EDIAGRHINPHAVVINIGARGDRVLVDADAAAGILDKNAIAAIGQAAVDRAGVGDGIAQHGDVSNRVRHVDAVAEAGGAANADAVDGVTQGSGATDQDVVEEVGSVADLDA